MKNKKAGQILSNSERRKKTGERKKGIIRKVPDFSKRNNWWMIPPYTQNKTTHPAPFPEQLANDHIISWSNEGDLVFDPFVGSGTTGKMAVLNNRNFIGYDICEEYCEIARKRIEEVWNRRADNA